MSQNIVPTKPEHLINSSGVPTQAEVEAAQRRQELEAAAIAEYQRNNTQ